MKSKQEIIAELASNKVIEDMITKIGKGKAKHNKDLAQDIYMELMLKDDKVIEGLYERKEINFYVSRIVTNQIWSKNSPYHYQYEKYDNNKNAIDGIDLIDE